MSIVRTLVVGVTQLIYPNICWICNQFMPDERTHVCATCYPQLMRDPFPTCPRCSSTVGPHIVLDEGCPACRDQSFAFDGAFRMAPYDGLLRDVILRMKQWTGEELTEIIGILWAQQLAERLRVVHPEVVIPVPLHWTRHCWRGFNQSAILATCLACELQLPCGLRALCRLRRTDHQTLQTSGQARRANVHDAFATRGPIEFEGKTILLVDDVMTSGATAHEAARALRVHRPKAIYVVTLAHGR